MIIGYDGSRAFSKDRTGTENYSYQLLKNFAKISELHRFIIYIRPGVKVGNDWPGNFCFKVINWPRFWTQGGLALQTFKDKLDVLFVPAHTLSLIRRPGLKTVVTVHDLGSEYLPKMHQLKQRFYLSFMQKFQLKGATKLIAVSKATKSDLVNKIGIEPEKISVIYEGFNKELFHPIKDDTLINSLRHYNLQLFELLESELPWSRRPEHQSRRPKTYYLFVGTVQPRKNLERIIKAFAIYIKGDRRWEMEDRDLKMEDGKVDTVKLVIAGSKGWLSDEIYKLPKKLGIENRVKFLGYIPDKDLPGLYSGAVALVFPSLFEGFGLPILEAQACGCPVITSNISSMPEVAGKGAMLVNPYDVNEITDAMIEAMDKNVRKELIKNGFENINRFSWEKCAQETLKVLEAV